MNSRGLLARLIPYCAAVLLVAVLVTVSCGRPATSGKQPGAQSPAEAGPGPSLVVSPGIETPSKGKFITILGAGLNAKEKVSLRLSMDHESDISKVCEPPLEVNENGSFAVTLKGANFESLPPGLYTLKLVGRGDEVLATAPLKVLKKS